MHGLFVLSGGNRGRNVSDFLYMHGGTEEAFRERLNMQGKTEYDANRDNLYVQYMLGEAE